jgi:MFS family permease
MLAPAVLRASRPRATVGWRTRRRNVFGLTLRPRFSPIWKHRAFRRMWIGETISAIGSSLTEFALPLVAVVTLHVTPGQMGLIRALGSGPAIVLGLVAGVWVDRVSRKRLLIGLNAAAAAVIASVPLSYALGSVTIGHLYALALAFGVLFPFWWPAWNAFLPSVVGADLLVDANSKVMFSWSASWVLGPGLGAILVGLFAAPVVLVFDSVSFVVSSFFLARVEPARAERVEASEAGHLFRQIGDGLRLTFMDPMQRAITIPRAWLDLIDAISRTVLVLYIIREVGLTPSLMGLALALSAAGFVVGSVIAPRVERRLGTGGAIVLGLGLVAASPYTMVIANDGLPDAVNVLFFALPGFIGGTGGVIQWIGLSSLRQSITPERLLGRVYASAGVLGEVLTVTGALVGGLLGETLGLRAAIAIAAVAYAVPFLYALVSPLRHAHVAGSTSDDRARPGRPGS